MKSASRSLTGEIAKALASGLYVSYLPAYLLRSKKFTGAGLVGTLWGLYLIRWLPVAAPEQIAVWLGGLAIAVVVSDRAEESLGTHDDPRIVIDEMIGYWTAMLFVPRSVPTFFAAFVLFRIFDVWKPGPVRRLGNLPGGWGIVMDDVAAGFCANLLLQITYALS